MSASVHPRNTHCIAYADRSWHNRKSAIAFQNSFVLAPASIIFGCLSTKAVNYVSRKLATFTLVDTNHLADKSNRSAIANELRSLHFRIVQKRNDELVTLTAELGYLFNCRSVAESVDTLLDNFEPLLVEKTRDVVHADADLTTFLLSSFVVLSIGTQNVDHGLGSLLRQASRTDSESIARLIRFDQVRKLDDVAIVSTPFTNEVFFGTVNVCKVANVFGADNCLFVASQPLVGGCEGAAVYNTKMDLIGIVICTAFRWKRIENASLTLVANFREVINEFLNQSSFDDFRIERSISSRSSLSQIENSVVLLQIGASGGSGCLVKIHDFRFILTCSHVVFYASPSIHIKCYWTGGNFTSNVIFKNPNFGVAYDVALLSVPEDIPDEYFTDCQTSRPAVGDSVYATGFPHFFALAKQQFAPSIFEGRITKIEHGIMFTDASVQAGQSGGPLLSSSGKLVGVMVSNAKDTKNHQIYPNTNMCIPLLDIYALLDKFATTRDLTGLNGLVADQTIVRRWNLQTNVPKLASKL